MRYCHLQKFIIIVACIAALQACSNATEEDTAPLVKPLISPSTPFSDGDITINFNCSQAQKCSKYFYRLTFGSEPGPFTLYDPQQGLTILAADHANQFIEVEVYALDVYNRQSDSFKQSYIIDTVNPDVSSSADNATTNSSALDVTINCSDTPLNVSYASGCNTIYYRFIPATGNGDTNFTAAPLLNNSKKIVVTATQSGHFDYYASDNVEHLSSEKQTGEIIIGNNPQPLSSFSATANLNNLQVSLAWDYPNAGNLKRLLICRGDNNTNIPDLTCNNGATTVVDIQQSIDTAAWNQKSSADTLPNYYQTYYYFAYLVDTDGLSSTVSSTSAAAGDTTPPAKMLTPVAEVSDKMVTLHWANPAANSGSDVQVVICRDNQYLTAVCVNPIATVSAIAGIHVDQSGLINDTLYYYSLFSRITRNGFNFYSDPAQVSATPHDNISPDPVTAVAATPHSTSIDLSWTNPTNPDLATIKVYDASTNAELYNKLGTAFTHSGLAVNTTVNYKIVAYDTSGNPSTPSEISSTTFVSVGSLTVSSVTPIDGATGVSAGDFATMIQATLNKDIVYTGNGGVPAITLTNIDGISLPGTFNVATNTAGFIPDDGVPFLNSTYYVTLNTVIADLIGNPLATPYRWSFTTADGSFTGNANPISAIPPSTSVLPSDAFPNLAMDANGNAIAVWLGENNIIYAKRYDINLGWDATPKNIIASGESLSKPKVSMDAAGNAMIAWKQAAPATTKIYATTYSPSMGWGSPALLQDKADGTSNFDIAVDGKQFAYLVWYDSVDTVNVRRVSLFTNWSTEPASHSVNTYATTSAWIADVSIAASANGSAVAIWKDRRTVNGALQDTVFVSRYNGTGWDSTQALDADPATGEQLPTIAMDPAGNAIAAWRVANGYLALSRFDYSAGSWGSAHTENPDNSFTQWIGVYPSVSMNSAGQAIIAWVESDGIYLMDYIPASLNGGIELWDSPTAGNAIAANHVTPYTSIDDRGNSLIVWDNEATTIYRYRHKIGQTPDFLKTQVLRTKTYQWANTIVSMAMDRYGRAIILWNELGDVTATTTADLCYSERFE